MTLQDILFIIGTLCVVGVFTLHKLKNKKYQKHKDILCVIGFFCLLPSVAFSIYSMIGIVIGVIIAKYCKYPMRSKPTHRVKCKTK